MRHGRMLRDNLRRLRSYCPSKRSVSKPLLFDMNIISLATRITTRPRIVEYFLDAVGDFLSTEASCELNLTSMLNAHLDVVDEIKERFGNVYLPPETPGC
jgi:hypothetical protein